jgi:AraC-like DNA-binding protein
LVFEWSTQSVSPQKRYATWLELSYKATCLYASERLSRESFHGRMVSHQLGPMDVVDVHCDKYLVRRRSQDISEEASSAWYVYQQLEGRAWFDQRNRRQVIATNDIVLFDPNLPFATGVDRSFNFRLWRLELPRLQPLLSHGKSELPMIKFDPDSGETMLLASWLDALFRTHARLSNTSLNLAFDTLYALLANAAGIAPEMREQGRLGRRIAILQRVMRQVELRASEPGLTAEKIAAEFAISLRGLHQLFELSKTTFHKHLTDVRLAKVHALLRDPDHRHLGIADIGWAAGFSETSTFYRCFKTRYGMTPGEFRSTD